MLGARLDATPEQLFVPKGLVGSFIVQATTVDGEVPPNLAAMLHDAHVEAVLRGPSMPATRILGIPGEPVLLPPLPLVGAYRIDDIRLVDTTTGEVLLMATPSSIPVTVFPEVLVSQVVSRPLTYDEIRDRGIVIDESNFSALEFTATFQVDGFPFNVPFPIVVPQFSEVTETIADAEVTERLAEAERINRSLVQSVDIPRELKVPGLDIQLVGVNFQKVSGSVQNPVAPTIPALVVIPGHVGFLNQFFSVQVFTANASPPGAPLNVHDVTAEITLPLGNDQLPGTADDPLALGALPPDGNTQAIVPVRGAGPDGSFGTNDDVTRLLPGGQAQGEFIVEGLRPGLHLFDILLRGTLLGFEGREVPIEGQAVGSVLVRNPNFSIVFSHPESIRAQEPYEASVTVMNTSETPANLVSVNLPQGSLGGVDMQAGQPEQIDLGTIPPGESRTATYQLVALRTGTIVFSDLALDDGLSGRFDLSMGIDERGVALSSGVIGFPSHVRDIDANFFRAADRVLGQALSVATAGSLPPGVRRTTTDIVRRRVLELAEAGQRLRYGDAPERVYLDLLLDWHGGRVADLGFDQILRETDAGAEFSVQLAAVLPGGVSGSSWWSARASDLVGRAEIWSVATTDNVSIEPSIVANGLSTGPSTRELTESSYHAGASGGAAFLRAPTARVGAVEVSYRVATGAPSGNVAWYTFDGTSVGTEVTFPVSADPTNDVCYRYLPQEFPAVATIDVGCDSTSDGQVSVSSTSIDEVPPTVIAVEQELGVHIGRPYPFCGGPTFVDRQGATRLYQNYGTLVAVLFSKSMDRRAVEAPGAFALDTGVGTTGASLQASGRVALVNLHQPIGHNVANPVAHDLVMVDVTDERGAPLATTSHPIVSTAVTGVSVVGRVLAGSGAPIPGLPVTLTMRDRQQAGSGCRAAWVQVSQVTTDAAGRFAYEFVPGMEYALSVTDTRGLAPEALALIARASPGGRFDPQILRSIADSEYGGLEALEAAFGTTFATGAIVTAESIDRAVFVDPLHPASPRIGSEVPVVLRFRGRGTVFGTVLAADQVTPVEGVAVNLFPDATSRELGRGVFSDSAGRFEFGGVPLGPLSIKAEDGMGLRRTVSATLETPGESIDVPIVLSATPPAVGQVDGLVLEAEGAPHAGATVAVSTQSGIVAVVETDAQGAFSAPDVPAGSVNVVAITVDGQRSGRRLGVTVSSGVTSFATVILPGTTSVSGRVEYANGDPVPDARVAGGEVRVDANDDGLFTLTGVPTGRRLIAAGIERDEQRDIEFTRVGSTTIDVVAGAANFARIVLPEIGRLTGVVRDASGAPQSEVRVALPQGSGFLWTQADATGRYTFDGLGLGTYDVVAPSPPITELQGPPVPGSSAREVMAASVADLTAIFSSAYGPPPPMSGSFGFARDVELTLDGQIVTQDITYLAEGTISGTVENSSGVPVGAEVEVSAFGPNETGEPGVRVVGTTLSDPTTGAFSFSGVRVGPVRVVASSPLAPGPATFQFLTTVANPDRTNIELTLPAPQLQGAIAGTVTLDGVPLEYAVVAISIESSYSLSTNVNGRFDTTAIVDPGRYSVHATDPTTGRDASAVVHVRSGLTTIVDLALRTQDSTLQLAVLQATGAPADLATVELLQFGSSLPPLQYAADANGLLTATSLQEGRYAITACWLQAQTQLCGVEQVTIPSGQVVNATVIVEPSGTITGTYTEDDGVTAVPYAQVAVGQVAFATTDVAGQFTAEGVPLGQHDVVGYNPSTGRSAQTTALVGLAGQVVQANLREDVLGEVFGYVHDGDGITPVPDAEVTLSSSSPVVRPVRVTTDAAGRYEVTGVPQGAFTVSAMRLTPPQNAGTASGTMSPTGGTVRSDIDFAPRGSVVVTVTTASGSSAVGAQVTLGGPTLQTDANGVATFGNVSLGEYVVEASSTVSQRTNSRGSAAVRVAAAGATESVGVSLAGVGGIDGVVVDAQGAPVAAAAVTAELLSFAPPTSVPEVLTDANGVFAIENVGLGSFRATAASGALAAEASGLIASDGARANVTLTLTPSATLGGTLVRADGVTAVAYHTVTVTYVAPSGAAGASSVTTAVDGTFAFDAVPVGPFELTCSAPSFDGVLFYSGDATAGTVDLGALPLDESSPAVVSITPNDGATDVSVDADVIVLFDEAMDETFSDVTGAYVTNGTTPVAATLTWELVGGEYRTLRIDPASPLESDMTYTVFVQAGAVLSSTGLPIGSGPVDRAQRPLITSAISAFTTADSLAPTLVTFTPSVGAIQRALDTVVRATFSESMDPASMSIQLSDASGPVAATLSFSADRLIWVLQPTTLLSANTTYTATIEQAADLAGNALPGLPITATFQTIDTLAPDVTALTPQGGVGMVVEGATVNFVATLTTSEPGVQIQITSDFVDYASAPVGQVAVPVTLGPAGPLTLHARGIDAHGNVGGWYTETFTVQPNSGPIAQVVRNTPSSGPLLTGQEYAFGATGTDDAHVARIRLSIGGGPITQLVEVYDTTEIEATGMVPDLGPGYSVTVTAEVEDSSGVLDVDALTVPIADGRPPLLSVTPSTQITADPGETVTYAVDATDAFGVSALTFAANGAGLMVTDGGVLPTPQQNHAQAFQFTVPAQASAGQAINVSIDATDEAGNITSDTYALTVADIVAPTLASSTPAAGATGVPLESSIQVAFSETVQGVSASSFEVRLGGAPIAGTVTLVSASEARFVPGAYLQAGSTYEVFLSGAISDGTNALAPVTFTFDTALGTTQGPLLTTFVPQDGATNQPLDLVLEYHFDAPVDPLTFTNSTVIVEPLAGGAALATTVQALNGNQTFEVSLPTLIPGEAYVARLPGTPTDISGSPIGLPNGQTFTELPIDFTAATAAVTVPGGNLVVEGSGEVATIAAESAIDVGFADWRVDGVGTGRTYDDPPSSSFAVPTLAQRPSGTLTVGAEISVSGVGPVDLPNATLTIVPASGDADGDGLQNGAEQNAGLNPWVDDAGADTDQDGWSNAQELAAGTDPLNEDTDFDSQIDSVDPAPLQGTPPPALGVLSGTRAYLNPGYPLVLPAATRIQPPMTLEFSTANNNTGTLLSTGPNQAIEVTHETATQTLTLVVNTTVDGAVTYVIPQYAPAIHHIALIYDGATLMVMVDGVLVVSDSRSGDLAYDSSAQTELTRGYFDELRIWHVARLTSDVALHYLRTVDPAQGGLTAYYRFDDGTGYVAADSSGNQHDAVAGYLLFHASNILSDVDTTVQGVQTPVTLRTDGAASPSVRFDTVPANGTLYRGSVGSGNEVESGDVVLVGATTQLYYQVDEGFFGVDGFSATALATIPGTSATAESAPMTATFLVPPAKVWVGGADANWDTGANWSPPGAPTSTDSVHVPAGVVQPIVTAGNVTVASLRVDAGSTVDMGSNDFTASGHVEISGQILGSGDFVASGDSTSLSGNFTNLRVTGDVVLDGTVDAAQDLSVPAFATVEIGPHLLDVGGDITVHGGLLQHDSQGQIVISGDALFGVSGYANPESEFLAGVLSLAGDFIVNGNLFSCDPAHLTRFNGSAGPQTLDFSQSNSTSNDLGSVEVSNPHGLIVASHLWVDGVVAIVGGSSITTSSNLTAGSVDVQANSALNSTGAVDVQGATDVGANATFAAGSFAPGTSTAIDASATTSIAQLELTGVAPVPTGLTVASLLVSGTHVLAGDLTVTGDAIIELFGELDIGVSTLSIGGELEWHGRLHMTDANAVVDVEGRTYRDGSCRLGSVLSGGRMDIGGDFTLSTSGGCDAITAAPAHIVNFDGAALQTISARMTYGAVTLTAPSVDVLTPNALYPAFDVRGGLALAMGTSVAVAGTADVSALTTAVGTALTTDVLIIRGSAVNAAGTVAVADLYLRDTASILPDLTPQNLFVETDVALIADRSVGGNVDIANGSTLDLGSSTLTVTGDVSARGQLAMADPASTLSVGGDLTLGSSFCPFMDLLDDGLITIAGDLDIDVCAHRTLDVAAAHTIVMQGATPQVTFSGYVFNNRFGSLTIQGDATTAVDLIVGGTLTLDPNASLVSTADVDVQALNAPPSAALSASVLQLRSDTTSQLALTVPRVVLLDLVTLVPAWLFTDLDIETSVSAIGDLVMSGDLTIASGADLQLAGYDGDIDGDVYVIGLLSVPSGSTLDVLSTLTVTGQLDNQGTVQAATCQLNGTVNGTAPICGN